MEENKEILELLKQLEKSNRQQVRTGRLLCLLALAAAGCCVVTVLLVYHFLPQVSGIVGQMQTVLGNLEQTTGQLAAMDLTGMVSDVDALVVTGQSTLEQTMEKLNAIDFETLNQAIEDLAAVVEPMSRFLNVFH